MDISIKVMMIPHAGRHFICATSLGAVQPILATTYAVVIAASGNGNGRALKATAGGPQPKTTSLPPPP